MKKKIYIITDYINVLVKVTFLFLFTFHLLTMLQNRQGQRSIKVIHCNVHITVQLLEIQLNKYVTKCPLL